MNTAVVCLLVTLFAVANSARLRREEEKYTDKYDQVNVLSILQNQRLFNGYFACLKDGTGCNAEGRELREHIPDALTNDCAKCTDVQKQKTEQVLKFLYENKPDQMKELEAIWDPTGIYRKKYIAKYGDKLAPGTVTA